MFYTFSGRKPVFQLLKLHRFNLLRRIKVKLVSKMKKQRCPWNFKIIYISIQSVVSLSINNICIFFILKKRRAERYFQKKKHRLKNVIKINIFFFKTYQYGHQKIRLFTLNSEKLIPQKFFNYLTSQRQKTGFCIKTCFLGHEPNKFIIIKM